MATHLPLLTVSQARTFRRCQREALLAYEQGYRAVSDAASLRFGTLIHAGLEAWFLARRDGAQALDAAHLAIAEGAAANPETDDVDIVKAEELLRGYDARWSDEPLDVLAVEAQFAADLRNPATGAPSRTFALGGKIDAIVRDREGRVLIVEHKTTSEKIGPGSDYWQKLTLDAQVSTYFVGARSLGYEPAACVYDVIAKPKLAPLKATPVESRKYTKAGTLDARQRETDESLGEFRARYREKIADDPSAVYQRGEVVRLEEEERDAAHDMWMTAVAIREARVSGRWPRNPDGCERYHRMCSFFGVCTRTASLDDAAQFRRAETTHEELTPAAADVEPSAA